MEREALRAQTTELLQRLRGEAGVPQALFELLDTLVRRLDRIELGAFAVEETPTKPERRSAQIPAVRPEEPRVDTKPFERVTKILEDAKKTP